ncbi:FAD-binding oxidoreductase [Rhizobium herbae]|uniref:FAD/FMN-containing dehydrogenase n=1 Tax=Rhizobium herbae TaxID=508661 RepID=A0ABS4EF86_9HYPH|nr:FAD-binding oxidoreductase [Rhizobium herbae]MBP1856608.1 FAD/FMN-containing dehydrogenase [Rhizobium herbae]
MTAGEFDSWGRIDRRARPAVSPDAYENLRDNAAPGAFLPFGNGRSYGDSCHNDQGRLIDSRMRTRILGFDPGTGIVSCDAGVTLRSILEQAIPHRFFLPVTPGTAAVTVAGAVANDVHGKNHHARGTFGKHVRRLMLLRSTGELLACSATENRDLFYATIGGMGLTGLILSVDLQLMKVPSAHIQQHAIRFDSLNDYFGMVETVDSEHEYSVAWIDQLATGKRAGRGVLLAGDHADASCEFPDMPRSMKLSVPFSPPFDLLNTVTLKAFNEFYFRKEKRGETVTTVKWPGYFHPLDAIGHWNRLYGPRGLYQHQSVYPADNARELTARLLETARKAGHASFLTVLKKFGEQASGGLLSFPRPGFTLTLDFANQGEQTLKLLNVLDAMVIEAGGAINAYKDARMSPQTFDSSFPQWRKLEELRDPAMVSNFWKRTALALPK